MTYPQLCTPQQQQTTLEKDETVKKNRSGRSLQQGGEGEGEADMDDDDPVWLAEKQRLAAAARKQMSVIHAALPDPASHPAVAKGVGKFVSLPRAGPSVQPLAPPVVQAGQALQRQRQPQPQPPLEPHGYDSASACAPFGCK